MLGHSHYYHGMVRKSIAVFGSLFNDISIEKRGPKGSTFIRVPLAYSPKDRYLRTIKGESVGSLQHTLPRMAFEVSSITADKEITRNKMLTNITVKDGAHYFVPESIPYKIGISLVVMSRSQDECLQIVEQIIPFFNPTFSVTVKEIVGPGTKTDIPVTLNTIDFEDSYEGTLSDPRRTVMYTLSFTMNIKFVGPIETEGYGDGSGTGGGNGLGNVNGTTGQSGTTGLGQGGRARLIKSIRVTFEDITNGTKLLGDDEIRTQYRSDEKDEPHEIVIEYNSPPFDMDNVGSNWDPEDQKIVKP